MSNVEQGTSNNEQMTYVQTRLIASIITQYLIPSTYFSSTLTPKYSFPAFTTSFQPLLRKAFRIK